MHYRREKMDCQKITGRTKRGCDLGKCRGREGNCCEVLEDRECRGHQKTVLDPDLEQGLTVTFPWSSSGQASRQCSFFELYEMCPLACSPWPELGTEAWACGERYWMSV